MPMRPGRYADLAAQNPSDRDNYELLSAEQWVLAGDVAVGQTGVCRGLSPGAHGTARLPGRWSPPRSTWQSATAPRAIRELDSIPVPTAADLAQNYWWLRGKAAFLSGHPVEGTRAFVERERYLPDPGGLALEPRGTVRSDSRCSRAGRLAQGSAQDRPYRRRLAGARTGGDRHGAQPHAGGSGSGGLEARLPAASRQRQRAHARAESNRRRHRLSRPDRAPPAAVRARRAGRSRRAGRIHRGVSRAGSRRPAAFENLRCRRRDRGGRVSSCDGRRSGVRGRPAHQGRRGRGGAAERRQDAGARAQFPRRLGERRRRFLSICASARGRGAHGRAPADRRREAQGSDHRRRRRARNPGAGGILPGVVAARRRSARRRALRIQRAPTSPTSSNRFSQVHAVKGEPSTPSRRRFRVHRGRPRARRG